jgi:hypothetical protein
MLIVTVHYGCEKVFFCHSRRDTEATGWTLHSMNHSTPEGWQEGILRGTHKRPRVHSGEDISRELVLV